MTLFKKITSILSIVLVLIMPVNYLSAKSCHEAYPCEKPDKSDCYCPRSGKDAKGPYQQCVMQEPEGGGPPTPTCVDPGLVPCGNDGQPACTICDFFVLTQNIITFIMVDIIPAVGTIMLTFAGLLFLFSGGNPNRRNRAKKLLKQAIIGIAVAYGAFVIINSVLTFVAPESAERYFSLGQGGFKIQCK